MRAGLEGALRDAVRSGRLRAGIRLPSSRALAQDLALARNTVAEAYAQLVAEGWLDSRQGAGTWAADLRVQDPPQPARAAIGPASRLRYDLRPGVPDLSSFPRSPWLAAARKAMAAAPRDALGYGDVQGWPGLRAALAEYLGRARGVDASPDRVVVCSGFSQGLQLVCEVLRSRGARTLACEGYAHPRYRGIATAGGLRVTAVPVDARGAVIRALASEDAALLTPAHQYPTGVPLHPVRRRQAIDWAVGSGATIIEDDYDGEFRYDRHALGAIQALAPEHVVYAGTASKSLAPGLRLGWLVLPRGLVDGVVAAKESTGRLSSSLDQLTLAEFITSGGYDRHVRRVRLGYRRRRDRLVVGLHGQAPHVRVTGIAAGLHALVELPAGESEADVVARGAEHGLALEGLGRPIAGRQWPRPALVVGYAAPPEHGFTTALARLNAVLSARPLP